MATTKGPTPAQPNTDPAPGPQGPHAGSSGVTAAAGGAVGGAIAGAAIGTAVGPIGSVVGAAIGAIAGGIAGKAAADHAHPTTLTPEAPVMPVEPDHEMVARRAYEIWEGKGWSDGHTLDDWLEAESSLREAGRS